jgi:hypothetical protein
VIRQSNHFSDCSLMHVSKHTPETDEFDVLEMLLKGVNQSGHISGLQTLRPLYSSADACTSHTYPPLQHTYITYEHTCRVTPYMQSALQHTYVHVKLCEVTKCPRWGKNRFLYIYCCICGRVVTLSFKEVDETTSTSLSFKC